MMNARIDSNIMAVYRFEVSINIPSIGANTSVGTSFTVPGLRLNDMLVSAKPTVSTGLVILNPIVSAKDTLSFTVGNFTGGAIDPAIQTYSFLVFRPDPDKLNQDLTILA